MYSNAKEVTTVANRNVVNARQSAIGKCACSPVRSKLRHTVSSGVPSLMAVYKQDVLWKPQDGPKRTSFAPISDAGKPSSRAGTSQSAAACRSTYAGDHGRRQKRMQNRLRAGSTESGHNIEWPCDTTIDFSCFPFSWGLGGEEFGWRDGKDGVHDPYNPREISS